MDRLCEVDGGLDGVMNISLYVLLMEESNRYDFRSGRSLAPTGVVYVRREFLPNPLCLGPVLNSISRGQNKFFGSSDNQPIG